MGCFSTETNQPKIIMSLTRSFRAGLPSGPDERQRNIRSNFNSGPGVQRERGLFSTGQGYSTGTGYGTGQGYDTGQSKASAQAINGTAPESPAPPMQSTPAGRAKVNLQRVPPTPNAGGAITRDGQTTRYAPSAYNPAPNRPN